MVGEGRFNRRQLLSAAGAAAAGTLVATADPARADGTQDIVGSWSATVTATDPPLGSFASLLSFHSDGTLTESRRLFLADSPFGPLLETGGHGAWKRSGLGRLTPSSDSCSSRPLHQLACPWEWTMSPSSSRSRRGWAYVGHSRQRSRTPKARQCSRRSGPSWESASR